MINKDITKENKQSSTIWGGRFNSKPSAIMEEINSSISFDKRLFHEDIIASIAHAQMLAKQNIISKGEGLKIINGLKRIYKEIEKGKFNFKTELEDIHMNVESRLKEIIGDTAGKLHTARSRNDQVSTDLRLWVRNAISILDKELKELQKRLIHLAERNTSTIMPGFTHLQNAQPITFGHHLLAYVEMFGRDRSRLLDCSKRLNINPLGSAALAGTAFPIDRQSTTKELNFTSPTTNSIDAVSDRDFVMEFLSISAITSIHISRLSEEIVIWCSDQFNFIKLSDKFSTGSSIMPQKRNPDAAELIRAKVSSITGSLFSMFTILKGLPLAYSKDLQEDKELVFRSYDNLSLMLEVMNKMMKEITINKDNLRKMTLSHFITATDLADYLVKYYDYSFRKSHQIVGKLVLKAEKLDCDLKDLKLSEFKKIDPNIDDSVYKILSIENSVDMRTSYGGTSPSEVKKRVKEWKKKLK